MMEIKQQLISYIAPGAPAKRRPASGFLPFLRPEIGFTPKWYRSALGIDFGKKWHTDPEYRRQSRIEMYQELNNRFPETPIGRIDKNIIDILTGTYGASAIAAIYSIPIRYDKEHWSTTEHQYLSDDELENLTPPDLDQNEFFHSLMEQVEWIEDYEDKITGFMNWQGVLNNAQRLRGQDIFIGIHNCAWNADPYLDYYAKVSGVAYIDMGIDSDLMKARKLFPQTRRAIMYTPMDVANKTCSEIKTDLEQIAQNYGPCDIVAADIEAGTPDDKVKDFIKLCNQISEKFQ